MTISLGAPIDYFFPPSTYPSLILVMHVLTGLTAQETLILAFSKDVEEQPEVTNIPYGGEHSSVFMM